MKYQLRTGRNNSVPDVESDKKVAAGAAHTARNVTNASRAAKGRLMAFGAAAPASH